MPGSACQAPRAGEDSACGVDRWKSRGRGRRRRGGTAGAQRSPSCRRGEPARPSAAPSRATEAGRVRRLVVRRRRLGPSPCRRPSGIAIAHEASDRSIRRALGRTAVKFRSVPKWGSRWATRRGDGGGGRREVRRAGGTATFVARRMSRPDRHDILSVGWPIRRTDGKSADFRRPGRDDAAIGRPDGGWRPWGHPRPKERVKALASSGWVG